MIYVIYLIKSMEGSWHWQRHTLDTTETAAQNGSLTLCPREGFKLELSFFRW